MTRSASDGINYTTNDSYGGIVWTPRTLGSTSWYTVRQEFVADDTTAKSYIFNYNSDPGQLAQCYIDDIALVEKTDDFIMDGGFESGTLDGVVDTNAYLVPADSVGGNGNYVLYLPTVDNDNPSEAWQMITGLTPGRNYTLSYRMKWGATGDYSWYAFADIYSTRRQRLKNPNYGGAIAGKETLVPTGGLIFILDSGYDGTIVHRITSTAWQTVTIQFTATTTSVYLSFFHYINTIQDLYIDDISMTEEAEGSEPIDEEPKDEEPKDEEPKDEEPTDEEPSTKPTEGSNDNVKTGDSSTHPYILIIGVVAFGTAVAMTRKKKISEKS